MRLPPSDRDLGAPAPIISPGARLEHVAALDGLRGIAVAVVVLFHAQWLTGGWVGVDTFFVLSGYLITRLLLAERESTGLIRLRTFWSRRFRRLMPALLVLLLPVAVLERLRGRLSGPAGARWDLAGALTYLSNWFRLRDGVGYWRNFGGPSMLDHVWSLAIEEQFYVVWPLVVAAATARRWRLSPRAVTAGLGVLAVALGAWALILFERSGDANRVYLGTDTRAVAIVLGAFAGALHQQRGSKRSATEHGIGMAAVAALAAAFTMLDGAAEVTYRGALIGCSVAATLVMWSVTGTGSPMRRPLSNRVLRYLGERSYGIYLWHWPIMVALKVAGDELSSSIRRVTAISLSLIAAEVSFRFVEQPIRRHGLRAGFGTRAGLGRPMVLLATGAAVVIAAVATVAIPSRSGVALGAALAPPAGFVPDDPEPLPTLPARLSGGVAAPTDLPSGRPARVLVVGDSVGLFLGNAMQQSQQGLGLTVEVQAVPSCSPIADAFERRLADGQAPYSEPSTCRQIVDSYPSIVERFRPDAVVVAFGAALFGQTKLPTGEWVDACDPAFGDWFEPRVDTMIADLGLTGALIIVTDEALYREPSSRAMADSLDRQARCMNDWWVNSVVTANSAGGRVSFAPLGQWICPALERCLDRRHGVELRPDGVHLQDWSAILAWDWMAPMVFDPSPPSIVPSA